MIIPAGVLMTGALITGIPATPIGIQTGNFNILC